jgi:hypothetical protein
MTLVISEVSMFGVAMAADSAITETLPGHVPMVSGAATPPVVRVGARKLLPVRQASAAISVWGFGAVGTPSDPTPVVPIDAYLEDFITTIPTGLGLEAIATRLATETNLRIQVGAARGGFHVGGYIPTVNGPLPAVYTVHTGPAETGPQQPLSVYKDFPNPDNLSLSDYRHRLGSEVYYVRNGDYRPYTKFAGALFALLQDLAQQDNFVIPAPNRFPDPLEGRGRLVRLQVQTVCDLYRLSNRLETIAQPVSWLTIGPEGIRSVELAGP